MNRSETRTVRKHGRDDKEVRRACARDAEGVSPAALGGMSA